MGLLMLISSAGLSACPQGALKPSGVPKRKEAPGVCAQGQLCSTARLVLFRS